MLHPMRGGMQVHAVPDDERALDAQGKPLPWGYVYADTDLNRKLPPLEKGPFGRSTNRRSVTRKAATPVRKEDVVMLENQKVIDDIFDKYKKDFDDKQVSNERRLAGAQTTLSQTKSTSDTHQSAPPSAAPAGPTADTFKEPTEVMIYGFGMDYQYAAIEFYETASGGRIYEDYDRYPPHPRYNTFVGNTRSNIPRTLSQDAIRRINTYQGGEHWIKVTFDSPEAAELACHYSPHILHGYQVYAEPFRGVPPSTDIAIAATSNTRLVTAGTFVQRRPQTQQPKDWSSVPSRIHSAPLMTPQQPRNGYVDPSPPSSTETTTASSATATTSGTDIQQGQAQREPFTQQQQPQSPNPNNNEETPRSPSGMLASPQRPLRIAQATRAVLRPASAALLPVPHWTQRAFGQLPIIGALFGGPVKIGAGASNAPAGGANAGSGGFIGNSIPRKDDGAFDYDRASWWWRLCWQIDSYIGTDICGIKGGD